MVLPKAKTCYCKAQLLSMSRKHEHPREIADLLSQVQERSPQVNCILLAIMKSIVAVSLQTAESLALSLP